MWTVLHDILTSWLSTGQNPTPNILTKYTLSPALSALLSSAILEQTAIVWLQAMQGYLLSRTWALALYSEFPISILCGLWLIWSCSIITALWHFYTTMWEHRNLDLHSQLELSQSIQDTPITTKVQHLYAAHNSFAATDWVLFSLSLSDQLKTSSC